MKYSFANSNNKMALILLKNKAMSLNNIHLLNYLAYCIKQYSVLLIYSGGRRTLKIREFENLFKFMFDVLSKRKLTSYQNNYKNRIQHRYCLL